MPNQRYESTLNTWLAEALTAQGLDARPENAQGGGKRLDVELRVDDLKLALEAERGLSAGKRAEAIKDADSRLRDELADCAIAICYPDNLSSASDLADCELLHTTRAPGDRTPARNTKWERSDLVQLASVIRQIPAQLGEPDTIADKLSFSLDLAVARLSESQKRDLASSLDLPPGRPIKIGENSRYNQAAKRAMLVVATAVMFHAQLDRFRDKIAPLQDNRFADPTFYAGDWPPPLASACAESDDPIGAFSKAWNMWLAVDYKPIFATARSALYACALDNNYSQALRGIARAALQVVGNIVGLRHDLLGRIFHKVLETARYDGSFYTTTAAATLLANLAIREDMSDWSDPAAIGKLRITDPACGTGTLLMAAAERIRDLSAGADKARVSKALIEQVLTGYDVNLTATHLAATTLGLLSPTTTFREMKIGRALLGVDGAKAYLGSLEFLSPDSLPKFMPWPTGVEQVETTQEVKGAESADLVIMNPPFTRDSLRHDQFDRDEEKLLKAREKELFAGQPVHLSSNGNSFLVLAIKIVSDEIGTVASILPLVTATNASSLGIRIYLAEHFHVDTIIIAHDPKRTYFSENTSISEMLLICRRRQNGRGRPPTKVVNLYENPATPAAAIGVARDIIDCRRKNIKGTLQFWPAERIEEGNWGAVQFLSPYLAEKFISLTNGRLFKTRTLSNMAEIGPAGQGVRGVFDRSDMSDKTAMIALWDHKTDIMQQLSANHDTYIISKSGKEKQAEGLWDKRGTLLLAARARLNTVRVVSVRLPHRVLGSAWVPCKPILEAHPDESIAELEKLMDRAICAYLNSTVGILAMIGNRSIRDLSYSQFSMDDLKRIPMPNFKGMQLHQVAKLAAAYDALCDFTLLPLPQIMQDETRLALDRAVVSALDIDPEIVASIRRELAREPSITGKPYVV